MSADQDDFDSRMSRLVDRVRAYKGPLPAADCTIPQINAAYAACRPMRIALKEEWMQFFEALINRRQDRFFVEATDASLDAYIAYLQTNCTPKKDVAS